MNTKQIWQALTSNTKTEPYFDGVFAIDELHQIKEKPELIICNPINQVNTGYYSFSMMIV